MNGILIIDKPDGITSHDVVSRVRRIIKTKRVGHTGTLDPFATGVMVVLVGQATRLAQFLDKDIKEYEALVRFGFETDTGDRTGTPTVTGQDLPSTPQIERALPEFTGEIQQTPPMYSAKKIDGKKLYELARKGETVERKAITVTIHELILSEPPVVTGGLSDGLETAIIRVKCSAGTYIRTLAEDIGRKIGCGAHLSELRRTAAGKFTFREIITLEQLEMLEDPATALIPMIKAVSHMPEFVLPEDRVDKTQNGLLTRTPTLDFPDGEPIRMVDEEGELVAIGFFDAAEKFIQPKVVLV